MITNTATIASRVVVVGTAATPVAKVAQLMREHHVDARVIVDEASDGNRPVGIITDRDLVIEVLAKGVDIAEMSLSSAGICIDSCCGTTRGVKSLSGRVDSIVTV